MIAKTSDQLLSADMKGRIGIPLTQVFAQPALSGPPRTSDNSGSLLCRVRDPINNELAKNFANGLVDLKAVRVFVEVFPAPFGDDLTADDVRSWVTHGVASGGIRVLSNEDYAKGLTAPLKSSSDYDLLKWYDDTQCQVAVNVLGIKMSNGGIFFSWCLNVRRPSSMLPGWVVINTVSGRIGCGYVNPGQDLKAAVREQLVAALGVITSQVRSANAAPSGG